MQTETKTVSSGPGSNTGPKNQTQQRRSVWIARVMSFLLMLVLCFQMTVPAHAYSSIHIQCSIDLSTWEILTGVVTDEVGLTATSPEWRRMSEEDLTAMKNSSSSFMGEMSRIDAGKVDSRDKELAHSGHFLGVGGLVQNAGIGVEKDRVLTFPTDQNKRDSSNSADAENALRVNNEIAFDLNQAFNVYCEKNGITKTPNAADMLTAINSFMGEVSGKVSGDKVTYFAAADSTDETEYRWRTKKYVNGSEYVTWSMLIAEAFNNFSLAGDEAIDSDNVYSGNPNQLTKALIGAFRSILDGLRSILGLWSMDELLFCDGWRAAGYVGGIFPRTWEPSMWGLFIFMEILAAMILGFGIINNVLKQAAASINTIARIRVMSQIQDLFVCGIALALLPIALRMVIALSGNLVDMVSAMRPLSASSGQVKSIDELVTRFSHSSGSLGGVIAEFLYFGIQIYFNFFYAIRSLAVFILVVIAPMMIAMITISPAKKQMTMTWMRELLANILIQPIQTFCITTILLLPTNPHKFDNIVALYAMIPLTAMVRGLFFGAAGSWADQAAQKGKAVVSGMTLMAAGGAVRNAFGGVGQLLGNKGGSGESNSAESSEGNSSNEAAGDNTNLNNSKTSTTEQNVAPSNAAGGASTESSAAGGSPANGAGSDSEAGRGDGTGRTAGAGNAGAAGGVPGSSGGEGENTAASPLADARDAQSTLSPANTNSNPAPSTPDASGQAKEKVPFSQTKAGRVLSTSAKLGGGIALGALGGAVAGAGFGDIGRSIQHTGSSLISGIGQQRTEDKNAKDDQSNQNQNQNPDSDASADGVDQDLSRQRTVPEEPVTLDNIGKRRANDSSGAKEMQVRDLNQAELNKQGISGIDDSKKAMEFTAKGNSQQAQELGAYADYLNALPPNARRREVNSRGIEATRTGDDIQVRIDKDKWSRANGGAEISARTNKKTGESTMRIKSPEGGKIPSLTGGVKAVSVNPAQVPKVTQRAGPSHTKDGTYIQQPEGMRRDLMNQGMSWSAANRAADRAGLIRNLQAQGYSPTEAAKKSKQMMSGVERLKEVSIPKAELSPEQNLAMKQAQQAGQILDDGSASYKAACRIDEKPTFAADPQKETSFSNVMGIHRAAQASVQRFQPADPVQPAGGPPPTNRPRPTGEPRPVDGPPPVNRSQPTDEPHFAGKPRPVGEPRPADGPPPVNKTQPADELHSAGKSRPAGGPPPASEPQPTGEPHSAGKPQPIGRSRFTGEPHPVGGPPPVERRSPAADASEPFAEEVRQMPPLGGRPVPASDFQPANQNGFRASERQRDDSVVHTDPQDMSAASGRAAPKAPETDPPVSSAKQPASPPVETVTPPSGTQPSSETNNVSSVQNQPTSYINPELAKRFEAYKKTDAYKETHRNIGGSQPPTQPSGQSHTGEGREAESGDFGTGRNGGSYMPPPSSPPPQPSRQNRQGRRNDVQKAGSSSRQKEQRAEQRSQNQARRQPPDQVKDRKTTPRKAALDRAMPSGESQKEVLDPPENKIDQEAGYLLGDVEE